MTVGGLLRKRISYLGAAGACLAAFALGAALAKSPAAHAQEAKKTEPPPGPEYPYLPPRYGEVHIPTEIEWRSLYLTAMGGGRTRLTEQFARQQMTCLATPRNLRISIDLLPEPPWGLDAAGRLKAPADQLKPALDRALRASLTQVRGFIPELKDTDVLVRLTVNGHPAATFEGGQLQVAAGG